MHERGLLARLDHAGIARLLGGGMDDDGAPNPAKMQMLCATRAPGI